MDLHQVTVEFFQIQSGQTGPADDAELFAVSDDIIPDLQNIF